MNAAEKIVEQLLTEEEQVIIQFVSPSNTMFWYTGHGERWSPRDEEAVPMDRSKAEMVIQQLERSPQMQGRIGIIPIPGYKAKFGVSGRA